MIVPLLIIFWLSFPDCSKCNDTFLILTDKKCGHSLVFILVIHLGFVHLITFFNSIGEVG